MLSYCSVMGICTVGVLCVSGLDVTIVGHFDFGQTGFYSIATLPTNFILSIMGAALGPLLPAASALSASRSAEAMGELLSRLTRYSTVLLLLCGLPMMLGGYWILSLWVGAAYAAHTIAFLRVLLLANIIVLWFVVTFQELPVESRVFGAIVFALLMNWILGRVYGRKISRWKKANEEALDALRRNEKKGKAILRLPNKAATLPER